MTEITQELVQSLFDYRYGELYWRVRPNGRVKLGSKAGSLGGRGYYQIQINGKLYYTHRLIFLYHHGYLPNFLDHIDRNTTNNKIENLREATASQNGMNQNTSKNSSSIYKGVCWRKNRNKWQADIAIDHKSKYLGVFKSETDAARAYNNAAIELFGEYANLNVIIGERK